MTSVFDTHPPLMYVIISYVKKLGFETSTHPPFMTMSSKFIGFFLGLPLFKLTFRLSYPKSRDAIASKKHEIYVYSEE